MSTINVNTISPQSGSDLNVTSTKFTGSLLSTASFGRIQATTLAGNSPIEIDGEITGTISGSITSTASFGTYIGDGGQLSGIETLQRTGSDEVSGSARVFGPTSLTGSLIVSGSNIEYTNNLSGSLESTSSVGALIIDGTVNPLNSNATASFRSQRYIGEVGGPAKDTFVFTGNGTTYSDRRIGIAGSGVGIEYGAAHQLRAHYLGADSKILSISDFSNDYWFFTSTVMSASHMSTTKLHSITASGDITMTGTGSLSGSILSTGSFGLLQTDNIATSSIHGLEIKKSVSGGTIASPGGATRVEVQSNGVILGDQIHFQAAYPHRAVHLKAGAEDFDVFVHRDSNSAGSHTGIGFGVWSGNYKGKGALFFERQGPYGVGRFKIAVDSAQDANDVAPADSVLQVTSASLDLETGVNLSGSLTSTGSFGKINVLDSIGKLSRITSSFTVDTGPASAAKITGKSFSNFILEWKNQSNNTVYSDHKLSAQGHDLGLYYGGSNDILRLRESNAIYHRWKTTNYVASHDAFEYSSSRTSIHKLGAISASGDITIDGSGSLTVAGDIRTSGDVIAQNLIVSSSITHMTTSFSSGSTKFGDTIDDKHEFSGSILVSGSITSVATIQGEQLTSTDDITATGLITSNERINIEATNAKLSLGPNASSQNFHGGLLYHDSSISSTNLGNVSGFGATTSGQATNYFLLQLAGGNGMYMRVNNGGGIDFPAADSIDMSDVKTTVTFPSMSMTGAKISGSILTTGSFGKLLGDGSDLTGITSFAGAAGTETLFSGSITSTGSFGFIPNISTNKISYTTNYVAIASNGTGLFSTYVGAGAGGNNAANYSVFVGRNAGANNTEPNTVVGANAMQYGSAGHSNVVMGYAAAEGLNNASADDNTMIGTKAGEKYAPSAASSTYAVNSVVIGGSARLHDSLGQNNSIVVGRGAHGAGSNTAVIGNTLVRRLYANRSGSGAVYAGQLYISQSANSASVFTGDITGSLTSTASFGHIIVNGTAVTGGGSGGIFADSSSYQGTQNDLQITGSVDITGSFSATAKSFVIPHPVNDQGFLQHGSLEGPEHGVYVRGHLKDDNEIILPDYWDPLVDESTISVQLTPIGTWQQLFVKEVSNSKVVVQNRLDGHSIDCYYVVQGERKDIPKIELEL